MDSSAKALEIAQQCYNMAYYVMPQYVFEQPETVVERLSKGPIGAMFFFVLTNKLEDREPDVAATKQFSAATGDLNDDYQYWVIQYPTPPPVDVSVMESNDWQRLMQKMVLAPYFSAMIRNRNNGEIRYFILGQAPDGGTTFRTVTPETNANLGPGCAPELHAFVQLLRDRTTNQEQLDPVAWQSRGEGKHHATPAPEPPRKKWWKFGR